MNITRYLTLISSLELACIAMPSEVVDRVARGNGREHGRAPAAPRRGRLA